MSTRRPITIIGGGLAGLSLGILLRREGAPVKVVEARMYPRNSVCGEFICGRGAAVLDAMGFGRESRSGWVLEARKITFHLMKCRTMSMRLPSPALCVSRYVLDVRLAEEFVKSGGDLVQGTRFKGESVAEGMVRASGRRRAARAHGQGWFGVKAHATDVALESDLEMHLVPSGYVGLCAVGNNRVNVCGLFRTGPQNRGSPYELLQGPHGSSLRSRFAAASFDERTVCSVAGISLAADRGGSSPECRIGDALTMIPPVTGNGMSMALESARMASGPLAAYSRGEMEWSTAREMIAEACDRAFARRLFWARLLQEAMFSPAAQRLLGPLFARYDLLSRAMYSLTR